ncbi:MULTISPECIES: DUF1127 domain-containing protein [Ensifer]|uniref:DUF1127 domain-containing protein n=2 Tax=Ensifer canadensis TaxID=555315 RepID=A0AAW4FWF4_9HYPH|nr:MULTISPECIES: DUF1127 domain-containing protein [Ensifer]KQW34906.1 hypothetical protein ASD02_16935 [Ensifer sp. Root1252]KRC57230.1 hypothetical protein ASE32_20250 [Ensifer sp. Root231]KRC87725.1 hypothetical protein ASE47_14405 [Ensifer sp. Root258]MBM3095569.1 DUF1127 domain-containing protein [Ensifer canadensis]UBI79838.1 DUF1127 domain-containing protein [Ensifer canadensis]
MSAYEHSSPQDRQDPTLRNFSVTKLLLRTLQRRQRRRATAALHNLDDRLLEDIGITRNDIPRIVERLLSYRAETALFGTTRYAADKVLRPPCEASGRSKRAIGTKELGRHRTANNANWKPSMKTKRRLLGMPR